MRDISDLTVAKQLTYCWQAVLRLIAHVGIRSLGVGLVGLHRLGIHLLGLVGARWLGLGLLGLIGLVSLRGRTLLKILHYKESCGLWVCTSVKFNVRLNSHEAACSEQVAGERLTGSETEIERVTEKLTHPTQHPFTRCVELTPHTRKLGNS